jgi:hypothetical protein
MTQSDRSEALAERVFEATIGALELNESHGRAAGLGNVEVLDIDNPLFRFYRLRP